MIPDRIFLSPTSRCLAVADIDVIDEDGNLIPKIDRGYSWVVNEKDPSGCNPEFVNIDRIISRILDKAQSESEKLEERYDKENGYYDDGGMKIVSGFRGGVAWAIKMIKGEVSDGNANHN